MTQSPKVLFSTEMPKGHVLKVAIETMAPELKRGTFKVNEKGLFLLQKNEPDSILFDFGLLRENLPGFKCTKEFYFSLNLLHTAKITKGIKKKDSVSLSIEKKPDSVGYLLRIIKTSSKTDVVDEKSVDVTIELAVPKNTLAPEKYRSESGEFLDSYGFPKIADVSCITDFKKCSSISKTVNVKIQGSNFVFFECDKGPLNSKSRSGVLDESKPYYEASFHSKSFEVIAKLHAICEQMRFYAPNSPLVPLKVGMDAKGVGYFSVYIKDTDQMPTTTEAKK